MRISRLSILTSALVSSASAATGFLDGINWLFGDYSQQPKSGKVYHVLGKKGGNPGVQAEDKLHDDVVVVKDDLLYGFRNSGTLFWDFTVEFDTRWNIFQQASAETSDSKVDWCSQFASRWKKQYETKKMKPQYELRLYCQVTRHHSERTLAILKLMFWTHGKNVEDGKEVNAIKETMIKPVVLFVTGTEMTIGSHGHWDDIREDWTFMPESPLMDDREDPDAEGTCERWCNNEDKKSLKTLASCKANCNKCWHSNCAEEWFKELRSKNKEDEGVCPGCDSQMVVAKNNPPIPDNMRKFYGTGELGKGEDFPVPTHGYEGKLKQRR